MRKKMDILDVELFRNIMGTVLDEIETNVTRTAYSPLIYEYKDYTLGMLSADYELMAQSRMGLPGFLADLKYPVRDAVEVLGINSLEPGDVFITNYAAVQGQHLNNVVAASPIFYKDELMAFIAIRVHWTDVGGLQLGSMSWHGRDIFQEGTQYRGLRVVKNGNLVPEVIATILANTRMEEAVRGDLMSQIGGCMLACRRWEERIVSKWDASEVKELWKLQRKQSTEFARRRIKALPNGIYQAECLMDDAGEAGTDPLRLKIKVIIEDSKIVMDYTELPPQVPAPINCGATGGAINTARIAYKILVAPDYPTDEGLFVPLEVKLKEGTLMTARKGAPMAKWNVAHVVMPDLILRAIGETWPKLVPAGLHDTIGVFEFTGKDKDGKYWYFLDTAAGGWGGSTFGDGFSQLKTISHGDNFDIPVEILEARYPLRVLKYGFVPNSAGQGTYRGGFGVEKIIETTEDVFLSTSMNRTIDPPWGLSGGKPGRAGCIEVQYPGDKNRITTLRVSRMKLPKGSFVYIRSSGGGGWGPPENRAEVAKAADRLSGLIIDEPIS